MPVLTLWLISEYLPQYFGWSRSRIVSVGICLV